MSIPGLVPQSGEYTPFLERTGGMLGDWNSRLVSVIGALSQRMHASRYVAVAVFTVANVVAFYAIRAFVSRLELGPAAPSPATDEGPNQDAKPLQSILCPILVGAAGYGVNTALAKATHYSIHPFILTAIAVAMSATYHLTRQSHIQPPASSVFSQPTHLPTSSSTPPRSPSVRTPSIPPSPNPAALSSSPTVSTPQNQISPVPPVIVGLQPSDGVTAFHSLQPLNHSNVKTIQTTNLSTNIDLYRARSEEHVPPSVLTNRRSSLDSEEDRDDGFSKHSDCDFRSTLPKRSASESEVESHLKRYYRDADEGGDEDHHDSSAHLSGSSSRQSLGENNLSEEGDEDDPVLSNEEDLRPQTQSDSDAASDQEVEDHFDGHEEEGATDHSPLSPSLSLSSNLSGSPSEESLDDNRPLLPIETGLQGALQSSTASSPRVVSQNFLPNIIGLDEAVLSDKEDLSPQKIQEYIEEYIEAGNLEKAMGYADKLLCEERRNNYCNIARVYFQNNDLEKALEILMDKVIVTELSDPIYSELVKKYCENKDFEKAVRCAQQMSYEERQKNCCKIARAYFQNNDLEKALEILSKQVTNEEFSDPIYEEFARSYCLQSQYEDAKRCVELISSRNDVRDEVFINVVEQRLEENNFEEAEEVLKYVRFHSNLASFYVRIGQMYLEQGQLDQAATILEKVIPTDATTDLLFSKLVKKYCEIHELEKAVRCAQQMSYEEGIKSYCSIARAYFQNKYLEKAFEILSNQVIDRVLVNPIYKEFARSYCLQSEYEYSKRCVELIHGEDDVMGEIFINVVEQRLEQRNAEKAEEVLNYVQFHAKSPSFYVRIGQMYLEQGKLDQAATILEKVIPTDATDPIVSELVKKYCENHELEKAVRCARKMSYEAGKESYCSIARAYFQNNDIEKALEILSSRVIISKLANPICKEFARSYCLDSKYENAERCIKAAIDYTERDTIMDEIFLDVAEEHIRNKKYEKIEEIVGYLKDKPNGHFECFWLRIGAVYIQQGEFDKSKEILSKIIYKTDERDEILSELVKTS